MIARRIEQASMLILAGATVVLGFFQMFMRVHNSFPTNYATRLGIVGALFVVFWIILLVRQPHADQTILPCVMLLSGIGLIMIARIDNQNDVFGKGHSTVALTQMIWLCVALILCAILVIFMRDYRVLRKFSYLSMVAGLVLLLSPMLPFVGKEINGARVWLAFGSHTLQPAEFAKLFLAFFFASYLFDHRDQLAVGGKKILGIRLPRLQDLGPILVVWVVCMGVLVLQHDLGTSLMFFAMFVSMLYVATGQKSWILIGFVGFAVGSVAAVMMFSHVGNRVNAWLHPYDNKIYNAVGGSFQLVQGRFGLATGGMTGTGLGQGHPTVTPFANSDFIYASLGEELGIAGLFAILALYLIIIGTGMIIAMKVADGFGKLLASGLVFTMAFQVFTVVGGVTGVIPLTGLTLPYLAAGGSSLIANCILASLLLIISNSANKPVSDTDDDAFQYEALMALREKEKKAAQARTAQSEAETSANEAEASDESGTNADAFATMAVPAPVTPVAPIEPIEPIASTTETPRHARHTAQAVQNPSNEETEIIAQRTHDGNTLPEATAMPNLRPPAPSAPRHAAGSAGSSSSARRDR
ncbi:FtsW/RodA/SpoVE family cell cycle protein [Bifidobacterium tissieri]|uniref:FtsW/RodA/SpoVE family cell cycle protein n=1 Tax=Bifidobacterium tissieri TaxID=1630162 RepID=A0A5M9ZI38_9BIFI|nr:FtsW/RodA/SpoVE family cell cycle protein [Bifidobacterium tissieri]KAA8827168.1 FtsW/RodA/SpoVE family cell cycle protein [Bifidobacterium tissieri]KAA8830034.1 FtsW/RodA/SpoVE family cell cycle protein [Bifidobacterium tissieri]